MFKDLLKRTKSISLAAVLVSIMPVGVMIYQQYLGKYPVIVASSPAKADISLNGKSVGKAPLTLKLKNGAYTIGAKKDGYEPLEYGTYVDTNKQNIVNIQLLPLPSPLTNKPPQTSSQASQTKNVDLQKLSEEIQHLKSIVVLDPENAATIPILTEKVLFQEKAISALRDEIKDVREQGKWYLGSMIAIIVGLLGVIATLFISNKGKNV